MLNRKDLYLLAESIKHAADRLGEITHTESEDVGCDTIRVCLPQDALNEMREILEGEK